MTLDKKSSDEIFRILLENKVIKKGYDGYLHFRMRNDKLVSGRVEQTFVIDQGLPYAKNNVSTTGAVI